MADKEGRRRQGKKKYFKNMSGGEGSTGRGIDFEYNTQVAKMSRNLAKFLIRTNAVSPVIPRNSVTYDAMELRISLSEM